MFTPKTILMIVGLILGSLVLAGTPDNISPSEESQVMKKEHEAFLQQLEAKQERLQNQMESTMNEHYKRSAEIKAEAEKQRQEQAEIIAHANETREYIHAKASEMEAMRGQKPQIGDVTW